MSSPRFSFPAAALDWMTPRAGSRVLTLGTGLAGRLSAAGHEVFTVDRRPEAIAQLTSRHPVIAVQAQAESLPFDPCQFDVVIAHQNFERFAPGLVLSEMARVLRPGGHAVVSHLERDDSVPWVKRLVGKVQSIDPSAMRGDFGGKAVANLIDSKYFPDHDRTQFRHWVPTARADLVGMVERLPAVAALDPGQRAHLVGEVGALYDDAAPGADSLRLPYQLVCHRAFVSHAELTAPIEIDDDGLVIPL